MKKRIIATFAIFALFALAIAALAYTRTDNVETTKACCCKTGDSCPMKSKGHDEKAGGHEMSCCKKHGADHAKSGDHAKGTDHAKAEGHSCCDCCGDSCPMKKGEGKATTIATTDDGKSCCGDSCAMKKGEAQANTISTTEAGKSCCDGCECCKGKTKTSV